MIDRRNICLGAAAAAATGLAAGSAQATPDKPLFVSGPMMGNKLAGLFQVPSAPLTLPDTTLLSAQGPRKLSQLSGRTYIVSLWGEWCAPCLEEATDLAAIARKHAGPSFGVIFVLTSSFKKLDLAGAQAVLAKRGAGDAPLFVEPHGGKTVMDTLATHDFIPQMQAALKKASGPSLPCNLLVDRHGAVRGRSFGAPALSPQHLTMGKALTPADDARLLTEHTTWATSDGDAFAAALAAGVLEKA
jgi:thiol-disulfide isomerase/thioredoxin